MSAPAERIRFSRRTVVKGGALIVGFALTGRQTSASAQGITGAPRRLDTKEVDAFLAVNGDGSVTVYCGKVDLGQGLRIAIPQIAAEELGIGIERIRYIEGDTALTPNQGRTSGSTGIQRGGMQIRQAAATARKAMIDLAAQRLNLKPEDLIATDGEVRPKAGGAGITVANKAQAIYANYLEKSEKTKLALFMEVAERAEAQATDDPKNANAHYFMAYALGRYSQGISVAKALAQGLGGKVKGALETAIKLQPKHADAHIALGAFHAEVIDKVGSLLGRTQGASKDTGLAMYKQALKLNPTSAIAMIEYANGLVMLEGDKKMKEAEKLYADAASCTPMDAMERLDVEMAKAELED